MTDPTREDYERAAKTLRDRANGFMGYSVTHHEFGMELIESAVEAADLLAAAAERMTWRPIETAPKHGQILVYGDRGIHTCDAFYRRSKETHWLPLPPAPKTEGAE